MPICRVQMWKGKGEDEEAALCANLPCANVEREGMRMKRPPRMLICHVRGSLIVLCGCSSQRGQDWMRVPASNTSCSKQMA